MLHNAFVHNILIPANSLSSHSISQDIPQETAPQSHVPVQSQNPLRESSNNAPSLPLRERNEQVGRDPLPVGRIFAPSNVTSSQDLSSQVRPLVSPTMTELASTLILENVRPSDMGKYECIVSNGLGSSYSRTAHLQVNGKKAFFFIIRKEYVCTNKCNYLS